MSESKRHKLPKFCIKSLKSLEHNGKICYYLLRNNGFAVNFLRKDFFMKNEKAEKILLSGLAVLSSALYIYSLYSAYWTFKRGNTGEIILYTALIAITTASIVFCGVSADRKRALKASKKALAFIASAIITAGVYLLVAYSFKALLTPVIAGKLAAAAALIMFGIALAFLFNRLSKNSHKVLFKITAAVLALAFFFEGAFITAKTVGSFSFLKPIYKFTKEASDIGGVPTDDKDIFYDFGLSSEKPLQSTKLGTDDTITVSLAKNEWEGFQVFFATAAKGKTIRAYITAFKNADGKKLETAAFKEIYTDVPGYGDKYCSSYADALVPTNHYAASYGGAAELQKGLMQGYYIRVHTKADTAPGEYTATLSAKNEKGEVILEKEIKATVYDFALPETPSCVTAMGNQSSAFLKLNGFDPKESDPEAFDAQAKETVIKQYYDYLLSNRISPYNLPYDILDERADAYMSDPRVTSFKIPYPSDDELLVKYYEKVTSNPEWAKKGYFYPIDEPSSEDAYKSYNEITERLSRLCPGYNMVTPFNTDKVTFGGKEHSSVELQSQKSSILCGLSDVVNRGTVHEEMMNAVKTGSRAWWYVCCAPGEDYCNFFIYQNALRHRILFWQQKSMDITGLLYWDTLYYDKGNPWETSKTWDDFSAAGDGCLVYPGRYIGLNKPVGTLRLMNITDGIEDYDYLTLAEERFGKEWVDEKISSVTSSLTEYTQDSELFFKVRNEIGAALSK